YYIHAVDYDRGGEWAGNLFMCTDDKSFTIRDTKDCVKRGYKKTGFFEVDTGEERDWTVRLTDPEGEAQSQWRAVAGSRSSPCSVLHPTTKKRCAAWSKQARTCFASI